MKTKEHKVEDIYLSSARKLRSSLPKFVIFLGASLLVWLFGTLLLIPLGNNVNIGNVEASKVIEVVILASIVVLIFASFKEIRNVADAGAGFVVYFVGNGRIKVSGHRLKKLKKTFRNFAYVILASVIFLMFRFILDMIHPTLAGIVVVLISIWAVISLITVVMAMSSEVEEATRAFTDELERRIKRKRRG